MSIQQLLLLTLSLLILGACLISPAHAGYEAPPHIDGCQSMDGRFVITAEMTHRGKTSHGPHKWDFVYRDTQKDITTRFPAGGIQGGQIYAQLFMAPDGETFALFNHVTLWEPEKSHMHGPKDLPFREDTDQWRNDPRFSRRVIIYRKDGSIVKELSVADILQPEEWETAGRSFNRIHWLEAYDGLNFKATPRSQYAFYRVSPDYTVLEVLATRPRSRRSSPPRVVRISLVDGRILPTDAKLPPQKTPVRPFQGDDHLPKSGAAWKESYTPSLDPVRTAGAYKIVSAAEAFPQSKAPKKLPPFSHGAVTLIQDGFIKADTPTWLAKPTGKKVPSRLLFADLEQSRLFQLVEPGKVETALAGATRGRVGPGNVWYGLFDGAICSWQMGAKPEVLLNADALGREVSLNDLAVSSRGLIYFTTLKDPAKGRLSVFDPATKKVRVLFDGEKELTLANPNGIALSRKERFLYVGVSSYKNRSHSGVYCFPLRADGSIDLETGKAKKWANVKAPDGIAVDRRGNVFFTAGNKVHAFDPSGRAWGTIKIPRGSGTNLAFDESGSTLFITTFNALYRVELK